MGQARLTAGAKGSHPAGQKEASPPRPAVSNRPKTPPGPKHLSGFKFIRRFRATPLPLLIGFYERTKTIWGMVTRQTSTVGVRVPEYLVDRYTAIHLCTLAGAELHGDAEHLASLRPGCLADLVAFQGDPMTCALRALPEMRPRLTIVGGRVASDLDGLGSAPEPCKSILPHNARLNRRALGNRFMLALVGGGEGR